MLSAGSQTVLPTVGFSPATTVEFTAAANRFYFCWAPDGEFAYWNFTNATYAIPLKSGRMLPDIPAGGIQSKEGVAALPGARLVSEHERSFPGPNPSMYAFVKVSTQRNIYRVPVQ